MKSLTKHKIILVTLLCVLIFLALAELAMVNKSAKEMARRDALELGINHLAGAIELYREDHNRYPSSLDELLLGIRPELKADIARYRVLNNRFGDKYEYHHLTNGFVITVAAPDRWFRKGERVERKYKIGEALK